jgi:hypothetical protein
MRRLVGEAAGAVVLLGRHVRALQLDGARLERLDGSRMICKAEADLSPALLLSSGVQGRSVGRGKRHATRMAEDDLFRPKFLWCLGQT